MLHYLGYPMSFNCASVAPSQASALVRAFFALALSGGLLAVVGQGSRGGVSAFVSGILARHAWVDLEVSAAGVFGLALHPAFPSVSVFFNSFSSLGTYDFYPPVNLKKKGLYQF